MLHLSTDRLAALGDEQPSPEELAHLATCAECAAERRAYTTLVAMAAAERDPFGLPLTRWDAIAAAVRTDSARVTSISDPRRARWPMQVAAGLLILAGGAMLGRTSAGVGPLPGLGQPAATASVNVTSPAGTTHADTTFRSIADARAAQQRYELLYQQAAAFLASHDSSTAGAGSPIAYRSRLAALDRVISTTREAMREAPDDPVINGYYLTTLGQREATLRQLNTALPTSLRLNSF